MNARPIVNRLKARAVALCGSDADEMEPVAELLAQMDYRVYRAETLEQLSLIMKNEDIPAILIHVCPSRQEFLPILGLVDMPPVIPLLGHADKQMYMGLLSRGAFDCVALPAQEGELKRVLSLALEKKRKEMASANAA